MINGDKAFIQGYNAQAAVDASSQVIVAADVSNKSVDKKHVKPIVEKIVEVMDALPEEVSADAGYFSGENVEWLREQKVEAFISPDKQKHNDKVVLIRDTSHISLSFFLLWPTGRFYCKTSVKFSFHAANEFFTP